MFNLSLLLLRRITMLTLSSFPLLVSVDGMNGFPQVAC